MTKGSSLILRLYFAVVSAVTLFTLMFGTIDLLSLGLKTFVFRAADVPDYLEDCSSVTSRYPYTEPVKPEGVTLDSEEEARKKCELRNEASIKQYQQLKATQAVRQLALVLVSLPLFILHFRIVYRDWNEEKKTKA